MANTRDPTTDPSQPPVYQIRLGGHLGPRWSDWFAGLTIVLEANGDTLLTDFNVVVTPFSDLSVKYR